MVTVKGQHPAALCIYWFGRSFQIVFPTPMYSPSPGFPCLANPCSILSFNFLTVSINCGQNSQRQINSMRCFSLPVSHPSPSLPSYAIFIFIRVWDQGCQDTTRLLDSGCAPQPGPNTLREELGQLNQKGTADWFLNYIAERPTAREDHRDCLWHRFNTTSTLLACALPSSMAWSPLQPPDTIAILLNNTQPSCESQQEMKFCFSFLAFFPSFLFFFFSQESKTWRFLSPTSNWWGHLLLRSKFTISNSYMENRETLWKPLFQWKSG